MDLIPDNPDPLPELLEERPQRAPWRVRLWGFVVVLLAVVLSGALCSYRAEEVAWQWLHPTAAVQQPCTNVLGPMGMYLAGMLYWLLGAAALYGVFLAALVGFGMLLKPQKPRLVQWLALPCLLLCACAALSVQGDVLVSWAAARGIHTPGGNLGYLDGSCVLAPLLSAEGALCALIAAHWVALLYFSCLTFRSFGAGVAEDGRRLAAWWRERAAARAARREARKQEWLANAARAQAPVAAPPQQSEPQQPETPQQAPLPQRQQSGLLGRLRNRAPEPEPAPVPPPQPVREADTHQLPLSFFEQLERAQQAEAKQVPLQTPAQNRNRVYAQPKSSMAPKRANLLDLMGEVEKEIELTSYSPDPAPSPAPLPRRAPEPRPAPAPQPAPQPAPKPEPQPAPKPAPKPVNKPRTRTVPADDRAQREDYPLPPFELLRYEEMTDEMNEAAQQEMQEMQQCIIDTLASFRIDVEPDQITRGPSITRYEFVPPAGLMMNRIANLSKNLMAATRAASINILAPVPGKGTIAVELANARKTPVYLRELLQSPNFRNPKLHIPVALGKDVYGNAVIGDLARMPHTLVAGTTGSGKSVCINSMILSLLYKFRPDELKLILVDPKVVEMQPYRKLPHLACPVVTSPSRVIGALRWAVNEMEKRYAFFSRVGVRNIVDFNERDPMNDPTEEVTADQVDEDYYTRNNIDAAGDIVRDIEDSNDERDIPDEDEETGQGEFDFNFGEPIPERLSYVVIIIDELADLMQQVKEDLENYISRLTQKARAAGIHLVVATQTPRKEVVTGLIKANIPSRIALKVASSTDSRIILESKGAENLLGNGDLLFLPPEGISKLTRVQGAFVSDAEIQKIIAFCAEHGKQNFEQSVTAEMNNADGAPAPDNDRLAPAGMADNDAELYNRCVNMVIMERKASTSLLQRRFRIGYSKAAGIMDKMEEQGIIAPSQGTSRPREVLVDKA